MEPDPRGIPAPWSTKAADTPPWSPDPPFVDNRFQYAFGQLFENTRVPYIHLHMPFLGRDASRLLELRRITALIDTKSGFPGFAFAYDAGSKALYGRRRVV